MAKASASFVVCDDISVTMNGKYNVVGVYSSDIMIFNDTFQVQQLCFLLTIMFPRKSPINKATINIHLPGYNEAFLMPVPVIHKDNLEINPDRENRIIRMPFAIPAPILRPGKIHVKIEADNKEVDAGIWWISTASLPSYK